jgi:hypothetical protein
MLRRDTYVDVNNSSFPIPCGLSCQHITLFRHELTVALIHPGPSLIPCCLRLTPGASQPCPRDQNDMVCNLKSKVNYSNIMADLLVDDEQSTILNNCPDLAERHISARPYLQLTVCH